MNKSIIDIEYSTTIRLFNTISHIIYSECSGQGFHSLRRYIKVVDSKRLEYYSKKLNRKIQDKDITGNSYSLVLDEDNIVHLVFMESVSKVTCFMEKPLFKNMRPHIHILSPMLTDNDSTDEELSSHRYRVTNDIFREILLAVSDISVKLMPKNVMFSSSKPASVVKPVVNEAESVIKELSELFANLIIANSDIDNELEDKYVYIINNFTEESNTYIKIIENSNFANYIIESELIHI